jgi:hypothetical protein
LVSATKATAHRCPTTEQCTTFFLPPSRQSGASKWKNPPLVSSFEDRTAACEIGSRGDADATIAEPRISLTLIRATLAQKEGMIGIRSREIGALKIAVIQSGMTQIGSNESSPLQLGALARRLRQWPSTYV